MAGRTPDSSPEGGQTLRSLKKLLFSITAFLITILVVLFALSNRQAIDLDIWPLPYTVTTPVYLALALAFLAGFLVGAAAMWLSDGRVRSKARERGREVKTLERKMSGLEQELTKAQTRIGNGTQDQKSGLPVPQ